MQNFVQKCLFCFSWAKKDFIYFTRVSKESVSGLEKIMNNIFTERWEMQHLTERYLSKRYEM